MKAIRSLYTVVHPLDNQLGSDIHHGIAYSVLAVAVQAGLNLVAFTLLASPVRGYPLCGSTFVVFCITEEVFAYITTTFP